MGDLETCRDFGDGPVPADRWQLKSKELDLTGGVLMGIVNVTPDSFSDGGMYADPDQAIEHGLRLIDEGATLVDVGGESTRPGATPVSPETELARVLPVVEGLATAGVVVSIDTYKPEVAAEALAAGAQIINDVTGCRSEGMVGLVSNAGCAVIVVHPREAPLSQEQAESGRGLVAQVEAGLMEVVSRLCERGVPPAAITIDPGIGFGKRGQGNLALISGLDRLSETGFPVVLGASRKRFLAEIGDPRIDTDLDLATAMTTAMGFNRGARVFRVHDVRSSLYALELVRAVKSAL